MAKKNAPVEQDNLGFDNVEQTLTKTEQFLENNARQVGIAVAAVVAVVVVVPPRPSQNCWIFRC